MGKKKRQKSLHSGVKYLSSAPHIMNLPTHNSMFETTSTTLPIQTPGSEQTNFMKCNNQLENINFNQSLATRLKSTSSASGYYTPVFQNLKIDFRIIRKTRMVTRTLKNKHRLVSKIKHTLISTMGLAEPALLLPVLKTYDYNL